MVSSGKPDFKAPQNDHMPNLTPDEIEVRIESAARTLTTIGPLMPNEQSLATEIQDATAATARGYFLPDEDERIRTSFAKYLRVRQALHETLEDLRPLVLKKQSVPAQQQPRVFAVSFCTACLLVRSGRFLVDTFRKNNVVRRMLDEPEPRFGIPRKQFTAIYKSLASPRNIWIFLSGIRLAQESSDQLQDLKSDPVVGPVIHMLDEEQPWIEDSKRYYAKASAKYRWYSFRRRHHSGYRNVSFALFRLSGSLIAELRNHWKRKRVTPGVRRKISKLLQPGDVLITRHDDATSNIFLPGFWPHAALHIGSSEQRQTLGVEMDEDRRARSADPVRFLEARKDGVLFRPLEDTLNVDCCAVLRPQLEPDQIAAALSKAATHEGKSYDFEFDFRRAHKLVCTEVVYRGFHGIGAIEFELSKRAGRLCLAAEDLIDLAIEGRWFEPVCVYGVSGNRFCTEVETARKALIETRNTAAADPETKAESTNA